MGSVLINLLPLVLASAIYPVGLILNTILLIGENGIAKSAAFIGGVTTARLIQGVLFGLVFAAAYASEGDSSAPSLIGSTLFLVIGLVFIITAIKTYRSEPDPDAPPKGLTLDSVKPAKVFLLGAGWVMVAVTLWLFTLEALAIIYDANLAPTENVIIFLVYAVGCVLLMLIPLIMCVVAPEPSKAVLGKVRTWMDKNNRAITIVVSSVFGALFLYQGITGLLY